jgi:hypothetical protein
MCMALVLAHKLNVLCITFCILELGFEISVKLGMLSGRWGPCHKSSLFGWNCCC